MPFNGSGVYAAPASSFNPAVADTEIDEVDWMALLADLSTALTNCVTKDGQTTATERVPFAEGITLSGGNNLDTYTTNAITASDASGASLSLTINHSKNIVIGDAVIFQASITYPVTANGAAASINGFSTRPANGGAVVNVWNITDMVPYIGVCVANGSTVDIVHPSTGVAIANSALSAKTITISGAYSLI